MRGRRNPERKVWFEGAVLTSVVPQLTGPLAACARHYTGKDPVIVGPDIRTGLRMGVPEPQMVGKDRIADAAYAAANYPLPVITVDLGTATTFNVVDGRRVFRGGVICPGLSTGLRALGDRCAQLPQIHLARPAHAIGTTTQECMLSGSVLGHRRAGGRHGAAHRRRAGLSRHPGADRGAWPNMWRPLCRHPLTYDPELMLKGLALLYEMNSRPARRGRRLPAPRREHTARTQPKRRNAG